MSEDRIAIEFISALGQPPVDYVNVVADLGCRYIGMGLAPVTANPHNYPAWSLVNDAPLRRDTAKALKERGVSISVGEGFLAFPKGWMLDPERGLDVMAELGAARVNIVNLDDDESRAFDRIAAIVDMADARALPCVFEFLADRPFGTVETAAAFVKKVGRNFTLVIDMMHVIRSGGAAANLAALDPALVGYIQVCDAPLAREADYADASANQRMPVGEGEFPILEMLKALPRDRMIGVEAPLRDQALVGIGPLERLAPSVAATRTLLAER